MSQRHGAQTQSYFKIEKKMALFMCSFHEKFTHAMGVWPMHMVYSSEP